MLKNLINRIMTQFVYNKIKSGTTDPIIMGSDAVGTEGIISTINLGGVKKGDSFNSAEDFIEKLIAPYVAPTLTLSATPGVLERGSGNKDVTLKSVATDGSRSIIQFTPAGREQSQDHAGAVTIVKSFDTIQSSETFTATATDGKTNLTASKTVITEGWMKIFFSTKTMEEFTKNDITNVDINNIGDRRQSSTAPDIEITVSNVTLGAYAYFVIPNKYKIKKLTDKSGFTVGLENVKLLTGVQQYVSSATEDYKVYKATQGSLVQDITYIITLEKDE